MCMHPCIAVRLVLWVHDRSRSGMCFALYRMSHLVGHVGSHEGGGAGGVGGDAGPLEAEGVRQAAHQEAQAMPGDGA